MELLFFYIIVFTTSIISIFKIRQYKRSKLFLYVSFFSWFFVIINLYYMFVSQKEAIQNLGLESKNIFSKIIGLIEYEIFWVFIYNWVEILLLPLFIAIILTILISHKSNRIY